tara:strand:- start:30 stop:194 length:165 start_codon:yes stop_codon:yes gene_type:complete
MTFSLTVYEEYLLFAALFWSMVFGFIFGWSLAEEPPKLIVSQRPSKAPPPEAFE